MNFNQNIKNELSKFKKNEIIIASKFYKENILEKGISETSFYKSLQRMYENNILSKLTKGIYYIPKKTKFGYVPMSDDEIITNFTKNNQGLVVGYSLYNRLNISTQISKNYIIYSSNIDNAIKKIRNIEIKYIALKLTNKHIETIEMLEILQNFLEIEELNYKEFYRYSRKFASAFNERVAKEILSEIKYKKSTISFLCNILNHFGVKHTLNQYLSTLSKYKHLEMEEIYEFAQE